MLRYVLPFFLLPLATTAVAQDAETPAAAPQSAAERNAAITAPLPPRQAAMKAHVMFLASDAMRGREAGSHEYDIAAQYVASEFYAAGLRPAGDDGGYLQHVPLVSYKPADKGSFALRIDGKTVPLTFGEDYVPSGNPEAALTRVNAPIVLVGQGIVAPQHGRDDYAGVDAKGKIVAVVRGAPDGWHGEERAHFGGLSSKAAIAAGHGAIGVIEIRPGKGLERASKYWDHARVTWADAEGNGHPAAPGTPILGTISGKAADRILKAAGRSAADLDADGFDAVALPITLDATIHTAREAMDSSNVAGILPGSDPKLKDQIVVLSAHLDHVGVGDPDKTGDTIYNGAEDNAVGIASLIEEAGRFKESGKPPRRSILFLAVTAEEKGLVGSDYFAHHPTVAKEKLVADVNLDMPIITYPFEDVIAFGAERSTLGPIVKQAATDAGVTFSPDPMPEQGLFVRSDHYRFVQQGIPSVFLWPGEKGPGKQATEEFFAEHYHQPSDQIGKSGIDWAQGVRFIDVNYQIARAIADADKRPAWNKGDFFGTLYDGYGAK